MVNCVNQENFKVKYQQYGHMLYRIAYVHMASSQDAEDALQEAFMKLLYQAPEFHSQEHEKAWLIRITINICKNMLKKHRPDVLGNAGEVEALAGRMPIEEQGEAESRREVLEEVLAMPQKYKAVIYLHYYEGYSVPEISQMLKAGNSAVKMRLKRGREMLRMKLEEEG